MNKKNTIDFRIGDAIFSAWWLWPPLFVLFIFFGGIPLLQNYAQSIGEWFGYNQNQTRAFVSNALAGIGALAFFKSWQRSAQRWGNWFPALAFIVKCMLWGGAALQAWLLLEAFGVGFNPSVFVCSIFAIPAYWYVYDKLNMREKIRRGATVGTVKKVNSLAKKALDAADFEDNLKLAGLDLPRSVEPYHFFVVGSTGSGKSVAIINLLDQIEARGDLALVVDSGGGFCSRYYRPERDQIINPFDSRCVLWSPTAELEGPWDAESLAKSMIPDGTGDSKEWNSYAQSFVKTLLATLKRKKKLTHADFLYFALAAEVKVLQELLRGTDAAPMLETEKTFGSIRTIVASYLGTYQYLDPAQSHFSISRRILSGDAGFVFLTYRDGDLDSIKSLISCVLDVASRTILGLEEDKKRRVWLIIDEFASIGKVQSIVQIATKARKMGGCLLLGLQSTSQLQETYGDKNAQTILSCLSNWLILRSSDVETSEYISKYIGESEISRNTSGTSVNETGSSSSVNQQISNERAIMPNQIQRLPNLQGFFKLAGDYPICSVKLDFPPEREKVAKSIAVRDFEQNPMFDIGEYSESLERAKQQAQAQEQAQKEEAKQAQEQETPPPPEQQPAAHFPSAGEALKQLAAALPKHPTTRLRGGSHDKK